MAVLDHILNPDKNLGTETITANSAGTERAVGRNKLFAISTDRLVYVNFGVSGLTAAATNILLPEVGIYTFHSGTLFTHVRLFAPSGTDAITSIFTVL